MKIACWVSNVGKQLLPPGLFRQTDSGLGCYGPGLQCVVKFHTSCDLESGFRHMISASGFRLESG